MPLVAEALIKDVKKERDATVSRSVRHAAVRQQQLDEHMHFVGLNDELKQICFTLLRIAQHYVPAGPAAFLDAAELVRCLRILQAMGFNPQISERFSAPVDTTTNEVVTNSFDYRQLRNKAIAGFATIADLTAKSPAVGVAEFQRGVREGYRRASDIAVMFLEDIQKGGHGG